jgi:hypothetical protein
MPPSWLRLACCACLLAGTAGLCQRPVRQALCADGDGHFEKQFHAGVGVNVGPTRSGNLAARSCAASLHWGKQELPVASGVSQLDLDVFGADLGLGSPVAAFQVRASSADCCVEYQVFALTSPPRLLRKIAGGDFFDASDSDLDGRVEIWTDDAAAVDHFEGLALGELDSAPRVVLRFEHGRLLDVSPEFQQHYDDDIARLRASLDSGSLRDFQASDGKLQSRTPDDQRLTRQLPGLRATKIKILAIVWNYLYSGREGEAWSTLGDMWPASDLARIRTALSDLRVRGILRQTDGLSQMSVRVKKNRAAIYDVMKVPGRSGAVEVVPPEPILLLRPSIETDHELGQADPEAVLDLVIDSAGKVRSAQPAGKGVWNSPEILAAAKNWKFIPAFKNNQPVASHLRFAVSPMQ